MKNKLLIILFFITQVNSFAQFSKTHYIPPVSNAVTQAATGQYMYISCPSLTPINFKIIALGGGVIQGTVSRDNPYVYNIGTGANTQMEIDYNDVGQIMSNKGFVVEAEDLVYVSVRLNVPFHAASIVSKGLAALGTQFRIGGFLNLGANAINQNHYTFATILATENNTKISFSSIKQGVLLVNNFGVGNNPSSIILNAGQSYAIAVEGPTEANRDGLIGALIASDKPVVVNCGSMGGSNSNSTNLDFGFDQIVSAERTGKEYILIKGNSDKYDDIEKPVIIAHENDTQIFINGSASPIATIQAGEYFALNGSNYTANRNLYIKTTKNVFVYQAIGGANKGENSDQANQDMHFVPPLSCETPKIINNIPYINQIGNNNEFIGTVCVLTQVGATLNFIINGKSYDLSTLSSINVSYNGPNSVTGNSNYETYNFTGLSGNVSVFSSKPVYLSYYGSSGAATYGGFYSGFAFKPEIAFNKISLTTNSNCIPNIKLGVNSITSFDVFQWYLNDNEIVGATSSSYEPTLPGYYHVKASISSCGTNLISDKIPVSSCPTNADNDLANDNIDADFDNDGIVNCTESYGNQDINISNFSGNIVKIGSYSNTFTGTINYSTMVATTPFTGNTNGSFVTNLPKGKGNFVSYDITFTKPINIGLEYPTTALKENLINANAEYVVNTDINKTMTVLNPTNQLLIDTNYDGIYESGVTQFSSFEIRFRLNGNTPLAAGTGTFTFQAYQVNNFKITHKNLLDNQSNSSTFKLIATCVPNDTDNDGISDQFDLDTDNDGILDNQELTSKKYISPKNIDANKNGVDDAYDNISPSDFDNDGVLDYLDLDSDNDGIYDVFESGSTATDANLDGRIDGSIISFGTNGLANALETNPDNGIINYTLANSDSNDSPNYVELDSDNDTCFDTSEAYLIIDTDGLFGTISPTIVNQNGAVTSAGSYAKPNINYIISAPIIITTQPEIKPVCELGTVTITALKDNGVNSYQWQLSTNNGVNWTNITNNVMYSNATTSALTISGVTLAMNNYQYRVRLDKTGNFCGLLSNSLTLKVLPLPVLNTIDIVQCDDDLDLISTFNLTVKNNVISTNFDKETFTYYTSLSAANNADIAGLITNPIAFKNTIPGTMTVWARVVNSNNCFNTVQITLQVLASNIPQTFNRTFYNCDDLETGDTESDRNGITTFNFSSATTAIQALLPPPLSNYEIKYYKNEADALAETNASGTSLEIANINSYRNLGFPNTQDIWVRVDNVLNNGCFGLGPFVKLIVNPVPFVNLLGNELICTNIPTDTKVINAGLLDNTSPSNYTYSWSLNGTPIVPAQTDYSLTANKPGVYTVTVTNQLGCSRTRKITIAPSNNATLLLPTVIDLTDNDINTVTVNVTGDGNYVYSLDDQFGAYQESNTFTPVSTGIHTVYVKDLNGCGISSQTVGVLGSPNFFTPNGDGFNDYWNIKGITTTYNPNAIIYIYDRYGKLLQQISPLEQGWNGTYNSQPVPADDYWYTVYFEDGRNIKGHFALKR